MGINYSSGSSGGGQIRTNQFLLNGQPQEWVLKEFRTLLDCGETPCRFAIVPTMVQNNPYGKLWNVSFTDRRALDFQADVVSQKDRLASPSLMGISYSVDPTHDAGQSQPKQGIDNYLDQLGHVNNRLKVLLATESLSAEQIVSRALTQSCAGCHAPKGFGLAEPFAGIGRVTAPDGSIKNHWPEAVPFGNSHVSEEASLQPDLNPDYFGQERLGFEISPALHGFFLPERKNFLLAQLNAPQCLCRHRFLTLDSARRRVATKIQSQVWTEFQTRFEAIDREAVRLRKAGKAAEGREFFAQEINRLTTEFDKALSAALARRRVTLPVDESLSLKPRFVKLELSAAKKEAVALEVLRVQTVNQLLSREPPRRTVTGSFRVH